MRVVHLTSAHPRDDVRIFVKQCASLAAAGYEVALIVADGKGSETRGNVEIVDVGFRSHKILRMCISARRVIKRAKDFDADVYHLHDPELLPWAEFMLSNKRKIFDAHEDLPKQILGKTYLHPTASRILSSLAKALERIAFRKYYSIVSATPFISAKFLNYGYSTIDVNNYPRLDEFATCQHHQREEFPEICYVGSLSRSRGIVEIVKAAGLTNAPVQLKLVGNFAESDLQARLAALPEWQKVTYFGVLPRASVVSIMHRSNIGLVTLHPTDSYKESLPVKMFEYMAAGIPVIASDFPLWRLVVETHGCGICVDPLKPAEIARAIDYLISNPEIASEMGRKGKRLVEEKYNWSKEEEKLLKLYREINNIGFC